MDIGDELMVYQLTNTRIYLLGSKDAAEFVEDLLKNFIDAWQLTIIIKPVKFEVSFAITVTCASLGVTQNLDSFSKHIPI